MTRYTMAEAIDPTNPGNWVMVEDTDAFRRWELDLGDRVLIKTEHKGTPQLLDENAGKRADNAGTRWGDGQMAASIPLNLYYASGYAEASRHRDIKWMRRFLADHPRLKTRDGDI